MTFGEYVDLDSACANLYKDGIINGEAAHKLMCILYRPVKAKFGQYYDIEPYKTDAKRKYADAIKELNKENLSPHKADQIKKKIIAHYKVTAKTPKDLEKLNNEIFIKNECKRYTLYLFLQNQL